jgi:hypothetical protein
MQSSRAHAPSAVASTLASGGQVLQGRFPRTVGAAAVNVSEHMTLASCGMVEHTPEKSGVRSFRLSRPALGVSADGRPFQRGQIHGTRTFGQKTMSFHLVAAVRTTSRTSSRFATSATSQRMLVSNRSVNRTHNSGMAVGWCGGRAALLCAGHLQR